MNIDKIYLIIGFEIFLVYFVITVLLIKSSKFYDIIQDIFNEIKQNKEEELIKSNQKSLQKNIKLKHLALELLKKGSHSNNAKNIAKIMNSIIEKEKFTIHHFNHYENLYGETSQLLAKYQALHKKSDKELNNMIETTKNKILAMEDAHKIQLQKHIEKNETLNEKIESLENDIESSVNSEEHAQQILELTNTIETLENLVKEFENSNETLEFELKREKEINEESFSLDEPNKDLELSTINNELNNMLEKLILDQEELINKINEQAVIIEQFQG